MDRRQIIRGYFQERHRENRELNDLYIEPIVEEFGLLSDYIEMIQMFGSIDEIPSDFVQDLADSLAYEYLQEEDSEIQREIVKRIIKVYHDRASRKSIERVLESSTDRNWIGGDLTLYKGPIRKGYQRVWLPREKIFYHDKSRHDSGDCYPNYFEYNYGVINFEVQYLDDRTFEMLEQQVPGGVRWNISQLVWLPDPIVPTPEPPGPGEDDSDPYHSWLGIPKFPYIFRGLEIEEDLLVKQDTLYIPSDIAYFDMLGESYKTKRGTPILGGKVGEPRGQLVTSGELGQVPGKRWEAGFMAIQRSYPRSGREVVMATEDEELTLGSSFIGYWNYLSAGILERLVQQELRWKGYRLTDRYSGGTLDRRNIKSLLGGTLGYERIYKANLGLLGQKIDNPITGGILGQPKGPRIRGETLLNGGILGKAKGVSYGKNIFTFDSSAHDSGAIFMASNSFKSGTLNIGELGQPRGEFFPFSEPPRPVDPRPVDPRPVFTAGKLGDKRGFKLVAGILGRDPLSVINSFILRQVDDFDVEQTRRGIRYYDINCHDDGYSRDGSDDATICIMARYREVLPHDTLYFMGDPFSETICDNNDSNTFGFEVEVF